MAVIKKSPKGSPILHFRVAKENYLEIERVADLVGGVGEKGEPTPDFLERSIMSGVRVLEADGLRRSQAETADRLEALEAGLAEIKALLVKALGQCP